MKIKKLLFLLMTINLIVALTTCKNPAASNNNQQNPDIDVTSDLYIIDISQETDWNYMVVG